MDKNAKVVQISGERCRMCRKNINMTQGDLAQKIYCSRDLISAIERGKRSLTNENAAAMAEIFGVRKEYLLCFDDYKTEDDKSTEARVKRVTNRQIRKDAFLMCAATFGYAVAIVDNSDYKDISEDDFSTMTDKSKREYAEFLANCAFSIESVYYSIQDRLGREVCRLSQMEYQHLVSEISDFVEFKIKKLYGKGVERHAVDQKEGK